MRNVLDCINAFIPLLSTEYELVLGRKGVSVTLRISFDKKDCFHLMGLQYLVDRPELSRDRGRVFDEIADGTITIEKIESSDFYNKIEQRVHFLPLLEQMIDSNDTVFKYNKKAGKGSDCAKSDYLGKGSGTDCWIGAFITCSCSCHDCGSGYSGDSNPLQFTICFISATT